MAGANDVPNLTQIDASVRGELLRVESYQIELDLTDDRGGPSERLFRSTSTVTFTAARPGESTFIDLVADRLRSVTLNGERVDASGYAPQEGITLTGLAERNVLVVDADLRYTNTGEGLHRFVDPIDGETYLYSQFEAADAKRMYACFDQPDLKAEFTVSAIVPRHWEVVSNGRLVATEDAGPAKRVRFATTARMSPYVTALVAGPYHVVRDSHDGIELGLFCRKTLAKYLDSEEWFAVTKQGFDWYNAHFGMRYPFDKYDQLLVPEFNAGAMENAGCVTFREDDVLRGRVTDARHERRSMKILHEMAHMWFGDLVTMRWWDDLWLNESFATYAGILCQAHATRWTEAWTTFANTIKTGAYRQDQLPTTHPIATDAPDIQAAELNFDGITYAKGASVLKQLVAYVGVDAFLAGLREYFVEHAYGNATLMDLLRALEQSSGRDLDSWSKLWLETAGINTISAEFTLDGAGRYATFELAQTAPNEVAASNTLRPHRLAVGLYHDDGTRLVRTARVEVDVMGERTPVPDLIGLPQPDLLVVNDDDLTYCKVRLDERSLTTLRDGRMSRLEESLPRALVWSTAWDMTRDGELATRDYVALVIAGAGQETNVGVMQSLIDQSLRALEIYADPDWAPRGYRALADAAMAAARAAAPGSDHQLAWVHALLRAARDGEHLRFARSLLDGSVVLPGLTVDDELRWAIVQALSAHAAIDLPAIEAECERDPSAAGQLHAATARALRPNAEAKQWAWEQAVHNDDLPNAMHEALIAGFAHPAQGELLVPYATRYFAEVHGVWLRRTSELAKKGRGGVATGLFPTWTSTISADTVAAADALLAADDLPAGLRRLVAEGRDEVRRALHAREIDATQGRFATTLG
ncbi:aminopeptidase N [Dactylosporangium sp. CA-233914]|uniref:aminopeptidase N n=1 Tax=Dactylosporangium sp. CA-233914 TaxID=3239934 RepID=UPI003D921820